MRRFNTIIESANPPGINQLWIDKKKLRYFTEGKWHLLGDGGSNPPEISDHDTWIIDGEDTGKPTRGEEGSKGDNGLTPFIGTNKHWWIGTTDTGVVAEGTDGIDGDNGLTPQLRVTDTAVEYSYDGITWTELIPKSDFVVKNEITNSPDEEDLTSINDKLKLKNKAYSPAEFSGLGRIYLRKNITGNKNILTQDMINIGNTIYIIQYDYDLNGATITIPDNCVLQFDGGSISNGTIIGNNTIIDALNSLHIFNNINANGTYKSECYVDWFGAIPYYEDIDNPINSDASIQLALNSGFREIRFNVGIYYIANTLLLDSVKHIVLSGNATTSFASAYGIKYDKPIVDSTIISTKNDIDLLHIAITKYRNSNYDNKVSLFIEGGCFDVSKIDYNSSVIKFIGKDCTIWSHKINTTIYGPLSGITINDTIDLNTKGIGIEYTEESDATGYFYIATIDSDIRGFTYGIKNSMLESSHITSFDIKGLIDGCVTHIDMGVGIEYSRITSTIQPRRYFDDNAKTYCIIGKFNITYVDAIFWDLNLTDKDKKTNRYAFFINKDDTITVGKNCENLLLSYVDGYIYNAHKDFNDNVILTRGTLTYGRNRKSYFGLLDNVYQFHKDYTYELSGTISQEDIPWGNPFALDGICIQPKKNVNGSNIKFTITNIVRGTINRFLVTVPMIITANNYSFKEIIITSKLNGNIVKSLTFDNSETPTIYAQPFIAVFSNDLFKVETDTLEVELNNLQMTDANINKQLFVMFEGSSTYNDYKQIGTREYTEISTGGTFKLHDNILRYFGGSTPFLRNVTDGSNIYSTAYMPIYFDAQVILDLIAANPTAYGEGARFNLYTGNNEYRMLIYSKRLNMLLTPEGYTYFKSRQGNTESRPVLTARDVGFVYYDTTISRPILWTGSKWFDWTTANMSTLTFTGAVEATYNGSTPVTVNIPTGGGGTTNYEDLSNKPKIGDVELVGTKTLVQLGIQPAGDYATETYVTEQITAAIGTINTALDNINGEVI